MTADPRVPLVMALIADGMTPAVADDRVDEYAATVLAAASRTVHGMHRAVYDDAGQRAADGVLIAAARLDQLAATIRPRECP